MGYISSRVEWTGNTSAGERQSERESVYVGGISAQIAEEDQEDPADQEEWEDEENEIEGVFIYIFFSLICVYEYSVPRP